MKKTKMKFAIYLFFLVNGLCQNSKIGVSGATIISSNEYQNGYFTQGLYFQRSHGVLSYGVNLNYTTYRKVDTYNQFDYYQKESFPEFIVYTKLHIPLSKLTSIGPSIGFGAYRFASVFLETRIVKKLSIDIALQYVNRRQLLHLEKPKDLGIYRCLRFTLFFQIR